MDVTLDAAPTTPEITFRTCVLLQWYSASSMLLMDPETLTLVTTQRKKKLKGNTVQRRLRVKEFRLTQGNIYITDQKKEAEQFVWKSYSKFNSIPLLQ